MTTDIKTRRMTYYSFEKKNTTVLTLLTFKIHH